jgi:crossover junction endodeoxyribonuclease RuvC
MKNRTDARHATIPVPALTAEFPPATRIVGVDPGLNITGYGVIDVDARLRPRVVEAGIIRGTQKHSLTARVAEIHTGISEVISCFKPGVLAMEELYTHYKRPRTAILMGHARGVICLAAAQAKIAVHHYASTRIKSILSGSGHAPKIQIQQSVQRELGLDQPPEPADVSDALAIALCHSYLSRNADNLAQLNQANSPIKNR